MLPHQAASPSLPEKCGTARAAADIAEQIRTHLPYAHAIAAEIARKLPPLERIDIEGAAELGLVEAANTFDPLRGVQFKTFAYYRIKGAVYDGLRKMGWYPKGQYQQMRFAIAANEYLKDRFSEPLRNASPDAQLQDLKNVTADLLSCYMLSLETMPREPEDQRASAEEDKSQPLAGPAA
jgi:RNA polymerase sigma factor for flagellar operon FliA